MYPIICPNNGITYKNKKEFILAFRNGVDVRVLNDGKGNVMHCLGSIRNFREGEKIEIRFGKDLLQFSIITV